MKIDNAPQDLDPREKELLFGIYNRMQDIRENYTGENLKKTPSPLTPDSSDKQPAIKVAEIPRSEMDNFNTPDLDQGADSILRPGETLENDFDVTFRKPNAAGGIASLMSKI